MATAQTSLDVLSRSPGSQVRSCGRNILKEAFDDAKFLLERELNTQEYMQIWSIVADSKSPTGSTGIGVFTDTLQQVQAEYAQKRSSGNKVVQKARIWLNALASRVMFYGNVMDVLVQQFPEYVSLAWGAFKFLFSAVMNHQEILAKLSKHAARVADLLPQQKMALVLYPTAEMQEAVAWVYASIMKFLRLAICFYKEGRFTHSIKSVFHPWALRFQDLYDELYDRSTRVKDLMSMAAKAELRDVHLDILEGRKVLDDITARMDNMFSTQQALAALFEQKMSSQADFISTMYRDVRLDLSQQRHTIEQIHLNQLLSMPFWQQLPSSGECLEYCQSMRRRRTHYPRIDYPRESQLQRWATEPTSSLLAIDGSRPIVQKDFVVDMATLIQNSNMPVIWAFRFPDHWNVNLALADLVRMLVLQVLQEDPGPLSNGANPLTMSHMREAAGVEDWIRILSRTLSHLPRVFILLDGDLISQATESDRCEAALLMELFRKHITIPAKIMFPAPSVDFQYMQKLREEEESLELVSFRIMHRRGLPSGRRRIGR
ncbi:MAG: hypothetical protein M1822_009532 [Bathelium mastoideum]|nr:MAG: hypothetical protein M1822_009532 [Bathelium mastoideum]